VRRLRVGALLLYVALDLANPLMPGALCFDAERSVEAIGGARAAVVLAAATATALPVVRTAEPVARDVTWRAAESPGLRAGARATPRARTALRPPTQPSPEDD
jgi:hypothetical protein